ncbi:unnamed protein product [Notodromas monacha]|uniref:Uncharacterized protein n=1 Tax=Notodromas monacha TaxID=399045 RepID=A0A7R9BIE5_9CRUS|nr:unnamed protein product [Notodromas monacha]CAG0914502.1 unnamed protein product [Notodromas monacha]
MVEMKVHPLAVTGKADLADAVAKSKVLVVGAGGIGCELLKNLVLSGFRDIVVVDLDTIDVSNLNRQFLFQKQHVSQSKAKVARESALAFDPDATIESVHGSIMSPEFGVTYFKQFTLVMNALDNNAARTHVNRLCLSAEIPLIESGTAGYFGQVKVIKKGLFECFECQPPSRTKTFPNCTIRNTPSEPIHCIVWAKHLFSQLFGEEDDENEVSPDMDDPELGGSAGERALNNNGAENTTSGPRVSTKAWAKEIGYDPKKLFMKFFHSDIQYLLSMKKLWEKRRPPTPLDCEKLDEEAGCSTDSSSDKLEDLKMWSLQDCFIHFSEAVGILKVRAEKDDLTWDKDDCPSLDFVTACSNIRAAVFGIPRKTRFDVKSMAGNIIPAIATTNAIVAGGMVVEAFKILRNKIEDCKLESLHMIAPDVQVNNGVILISSEEGEIDTTNRTLADFQIRDGTELSCDDFLQDYSLVVCILDVEEPLENGEEFQVIGKDALATFEESRKTDLADGKAELVVSTSEAIEIDEEELTYAGEKIYGMDDDDDADAIKEVPLDVSETKKRGLSQDGIIDEPVAKKVKVASQIKSRRRSPCRNCEMCNYNDPSLEYELAAAALDAFADEDYGVAIEQLTLILLEGTELRPNLLLKRAECFYKIERYVEALNDVNYLLEELPDHTRALHFKARVLLSCHQIKEARDIFVELSQRKEVLDSDLKVFEYIRLSEEKLARIESQKLRLLAVEEEALRKKTESEEVEKMAASTASAAEAVKAPSKIRHEWYQTDATVIVSVLAKGLTKDLVNVDATTHTLVLELKYPDETKRVEIDLLHPIKSVETSFKVTPSKVEVTLKKTEGVRWDKLEANPADVQQRLADVRPSYPTSAKCHHNWDALEQEVKKEEAEEKLEGDAALQKVFADIYAGASDEAKRAMNKSYVESGGTVLSTNWNDIKEKKTDVKPPDGMEFKKW